MLQIKKKKKTHKNKGEQWGRFHRLITSARVFRAGLQFEICVGL